MILLFLIMRCTPTIRELIEATPLSLFSLSATSLSALAPAQRAGAQRLCALAQSCRSYANSIPLLIRNKAISREPSAWNQAREGAISRSQWGSCDINPSVVCANFGAFLAAAF
jgi:hypothetical protein